MIIRLETRCTDVQAYVRLLSLRRRKQAVKSG